MSLPDGGVPASPVPDVLMPAYQSVLAQEIIASGQPLSAEQQEFAQRVFAAGARAGTAAVRTLIEKPTVGSVGASAAALEAVQPKPEGNATETLSDVADALAPAQPAEAASKVDSRTPEQIMGALEDVAARCPQILTFGPAGNPDKTEDFANDVGGAAYSKAAEHGTVVGGFTVANLEALAAADKSPEGQVRPHEVVVYAHTNGAYAEQMPQDLQGEPQVSVIYHASLNYGLRDKYGAQSLTLRQVLPLSAARDIDTMLAVGNPTPTRTLAENAIITELEQLGDSSKLKGKDRENFERLQRALGMLDAMVPYLDDDANKGKSASVITLSNVDGLGAGRDQGSAGGYNRRVAPIKKFYPPTAPAVSQPGLGNIIKTLRNKQ